MLKKIVLGTLFIGLIGILIYGAILRTNAKTSSGNGEGAGAGNGFAGAQNRAAGETGVAFGRGQGQGQRQGQTSRPAGEQSLAAPELEQGATPRDARVSEWQTVEGTITSVGAAAMVVELADGRQLLVEGHPWLYVQTQAFSPRVGDQMVLEIFEEDGELKPGQIKNLSNGQAVTLRLEDGQPMWAGSLQNDLGQAAEIGQGQDRVQSRGRGNGGAARGLSEQADAEILAADRLTFEGIVVTVNSGELVIEADANEPVVVEGRAWTYALEQGADVQVGHVVIVRGVVEDGEFKASSLENLTTGHQVTVRDAVGRPLWSGGQRGGT